jgi:hypothetical protein
MQYYRKKFKDFIEIKRNELKMKEDLNRKHKEEIDELLMRQKIEEEQIDIRLRKNEERLDKLIKEFFGKFVEKDLDGKY